MKRTAILVAWLLSMTAAYYLGRVVPDDEVVVVAPEPTTAAVPAVVMTGEPARGAGAARDEDVVERAARRSEQGDLIGAIMLLEEHRRVHAFDATALFLLSDLKQMAGDVDGALVPLVEIMAYPPTPAEAGTARRRLSLLIDARERQLVNTGDIAGLVGYFRRLVDLEPAYDGHRLKLARWLARDGRLDEATRVLREVGQVGVTPEQIAALEREILLASTALPIERSGGALFTSVRLGGRHTVREHRFLIDTGATTTGLGMSVLESIGATPLERSAQVRTANGIAVMPIYRVGEMAVGPVVMKDVQVLGLSDLPPEVDGLLGMDVLDHLSDAGLPTVGRP